MEDLEKNALKDLCKLMNEHPELPVIPMVDSEVVLGDEFCYWICALKSASAEDYIVSPTGAVICRDPDNVMETLELVLPTEKFETLPETEAECKPYYDELPWKKAIMLFIGTADLN